MIHWLELVGDVDEGWDIEILITERLGDYYNFERQNEIYESDVSCALPLPPHHTLAVRQSYDIHLYVNSNL